MMDRSASLGVLCHHVGMPVIPRLSDTTHSAQPSPHLHPITLECLCMYVLKCVCMYVHRLAYNSVYKQKHDVSLLLHKPTHTQIKCKKSLCMLMGLDTFLWQVAEQATMSETNHNSASSSFSQKLIRDSESEVAREKGKERREKSRQ